MIDYTKLEIRKVGGGYQVFDLLNDKNILEVRTSVRDGGTAKVGIYDVRSGPAVLLKEVTRRRFNPSHLTEIVYNTIDGMTCEVCRVEWGPICDACADEAGDKTFLLFKDLERMVDDSRSKQE